jgi:hypothetical protein
MSEENLAQLRQSKPTRMNHACLSQLSPNLGHLRVVIHQYRFKTYDASAAVQQLDASPVKLIAPIDIC